MRRSSGSPTSCHAGSTKRRASYSRRRRSSWREWSSVTTSSSTADFHHHNILASTRGHLAIDPQPFLGEPEYDVVTFLWNPLPIGLRPELFHARLAAFVAAGLDERRIRAWMVIRGSYLLPEEADGLLALV